MKQPQIPDNHREKLQAQAVPQWLLRLLPVLGFTAGLFIWLVDALIDVYLLHPDESLLECIFSDSPTELWMRSLVVVVMTSAAFIAQHFLKRQQLVSHLLRKYQLHLEELVAERTHELEEMASLDPLTRIYNRRKFTEVMMREIARCRRYQQPLSLLMCDIDHFKDVNDRYGHQVGDEVLCDIARALKSCLRGSDSYARWGGEEFIVLLPQTNIKQAVAVAENLRSCIAEINSQGGVRITASVGVSSLDEDEEFSPMVKRADDALYQAKKTGRNRVVAAA